MCTVTVVRIEDRVRLACNRDESRWRPPALPPEVRRLARCRAVMPIDPVSDGSWIGVNDAGLAATLLNVYPAPLPGAETSGGMSSRGSLVPTLLDCLTLEEALRAAATLDAARYPPFRMLILDAQRLIDFYSDGRHTREQLVPLAKPLMFTSSGLGDAVVDGPRRSLFEQMFLNTADAQRDPAAAQDAFHRHSWPDRRRISVCMERAEARTVSHSVVELTPTRVTLVYVPDAPDRAEPLPAASLERCAPPRRKDPP